MPKSSKIIKSIKKRVTALKESWLAEELSPSPTKLPKKTATKKKASKRK